MRTIFCFLLLLAVVATLSPMGQATAVRDDKNYHLEQFTYPSNVPGIMFGDYSALSNSTWLVSGYTDPDFDTVGIIVRNGQTEVFRVGTPLQDYTWYWGINDKQTTVGFTDGPGFTISGWMRNKNGNVRTFSNPDADVYLYRLNNHDVAVGEAVYDFSFWRPVIVDDNGMRIVDPPGVPLDAPAYYASINNAGTIVGGMRDPDTMEHTCLLWNNGNVTAITHAGASFVAPRAINNRGQVAGFWIEANFDPVINDFRRHGFIRDHNGELRTVDVEYPWAATIEFPEGDILYLVGQTTEILDMNDRGQILIQATGYYDWDGFVLPTWTYAIATPVR